MTRIPDTTINVNNGFVTIRIPATVVAGMTQEYWDTLAINARRLVPDVAPVRNLVCTVSAPILTL